VLKFCKPEILISGDVMVCHSEDRRKSTKIHP